MAMKPSIGSGRDEDIYRREPVKPPLTLDPSYGHFASGSVGSHDRVFANAALSLSSAVPEFFWERKDSWLGQVFGKRDISSVELVIGPEPKFSRLEPPLIERPVQQHTDEVVYSTNQPMGVSARPFYMFAVSKNTVREESAKREDMCGEWANLILMNIDAFAVCEALSANNKFFSRHDLIGSIQSCLAGKATSTIQKRLSSMGRFAEWCATRGRESFFL